MTDDATTDLDLRPATLDDAAAYLEFVRRLHAETPFYRRTLDEIAATVEAAREHIAEATREPWCDMYLVHDGDRVVAELALAESRFLRERGDIELHIGVLREQWGSGLGRRLMALAEDRARARGAHRITLWVLGNNHRGLAFYQRMGYEIEGRHRQDTLIDGIRVDGILMGKLLGA